MLCYVMLCYVMLCYVMLCYKEKLIRELNTLRCHSLLKHKRFGHSPSSVCRNMRVAQYKSLTEKCARKARAQETNNQSACT